MGKQKKARAVCGASGARRNVDTGTIQKKNIIVNNNVAIRAVYLGYAAHCAGLPDERIAPMMDACFGGVQ